MCPAYLSGKGRVKVSAVLVTRLGDRCLSSPGQIWIPAKKRWVHADPCENKLDKPRMYEEGWNKRLSYVVAFDRDGVVDVTRRWAVVREDALLCSPMRGSSGLPCRRWGFIVPRLREASNGPWFQDADGVSVPRKTDLPFMSSACCCCIRCGFARRPPPPSSGIRVAG